MVQINFALREVNCKIVYYGPGRSGKTTNLEIIHQKAPQGSIGDMMSIATETDRTLFFDFLPLDLGQVAGMSTKFQLYTVPGQVYYRATRKLVLQGADGVVFVADSQADMMEENLQSLQDMEENLRENNIDINDIPVVFQWNKRDLDNILPEEELNQQINKLNAPHFGAIAVKGDGVFPTLKALAACVIKKLNKEHGYGDEELPAPPPPPPKPEAAAPAPAPAPEPKMEDKQSAAMAIAADLASVAAPTAQPEKKNPVAPPPPPAPSAPPPPPAPAQAAPQQEAPEQPAAASAPAPKAAPVFEQEASTVVEKKSPPPPAPQAPQPPEEASASPAEESEEDSNAVSRELKRRREERQRKAEAEKERIMLKSKKPIKKGGINPVLLILGLVVLGAIGFIIWMVLG